MSWFREALAVLVAAGAYFFGTGLDGLWPLVWIAPLPVLVLAFRSSGRRSAAIAFVAYVLGGLNLASYLIPLVPPAVVGAALVIPALAFSLAVLAQRYATLRCTHWGSIFVFPGVWTSYEFLISIVSPDGTALNLAYSQAHVLPIVQLAAVTGIWGISFLVTLVPSGLAAAWHWRGSRLVLPAVGVPVCLTLAAWGYGWARLVAEAPQPTLRVGAATTDENLDVSYASDRDETLPVVSAYARRVGELARRGAQVVVLPEKFVGVTPEYEEEAFEILADSARQYRVTVVAGFNRVGRDVWRNTALVFGPDGKELAKYDKAFLVPGLESGYQPGNSPGLFSALGTTAGVAICKDMDFPRWLRRYAKGGARILFVPAWDFVVDGPLHARMAILRGVEGGFAVVRSAQEGLVTISDDRGRILAGRVSSEEAEVLVSGDVPLGPGETVYGLGGDWFGVTSWLMTSILLVTAAVRRRGKPDV
jgi:apolipoprotein N-acyltransferase